MYSLQPKFCYRIPSLVLVCSFFSFTIANASVIIPKPSGQYGVGLSTMKLTDNTRYDPFAPHHEFRHVMISVLYPAVSANSCSTILVDYMPPTTAAIEDQFYGQYGLPNGTFEILKLSLCKETARMAGRIPSFPVVLFSPGLGNSRLLYSALAQSIASFGYVVVSIDHSVKTRAQDISFVIDQLSLPSIVESLLPSVKGVLKTHKVAMYGHSLGGAAAADVMLNDSRIIGGANLDGSFFGAILEHDLSRPFLIFGHEGKNQSTDASWNTTWHELHGWKLELMLHGAQHATFSDLPFLVKVLGLEKVLPPSVEFLLGPIDGARALYILSEYLIAFFEFVQKGVSSALLQGPDKAFPEVSVVAKG
jgi:pimeloyl-ACP methyl ester carboxylesterase